MVIKVSKLMKTITIGSFFVLFAIVAGMAAMAPSAFADHSTASVSNPPGTSVPGCEETMECFVPHTVTIDVGGEVTWTNDDTAAHTVTSGTPADGPDGFFDSSLFMAGTTFSFVFDDFDPGEYPYFCMVHPWMEGIVVVQEAGAEEMEEEMMETEGEIMVNIESQPAGAGERMTIEVTFMNMDGSSVEHVNYNVKAMQDGQTVLDDMGVHDHDGSMSHETEPLPSAASGSNPVDIEVEFLGFGVNEPFTGPVGHMESAQVVPEFGTIAVMILAVAIVSIIAVTSKSKVIPRL